MGLDFYGLRAAKRVIAEMRKEMADDPMQRRSQDAFVRGKRDALRDLEARINAALKTPAKSSDT